MPTIDWSLERFPRCRTGRWLSAMALLLLAGCSSVPKPSADQHLQTTTNAGAIYLVRRGDTLSTIASRFYVSATAMQRRNGLARPDVLQVGQQLIIPSKQNTFRWPLALLDISSDFRSPRRNHQGMDLRAARATPILAAAAGRVAFAGTQNGFGRVVILQHVDGMRTLYAHTQANLVRVGQQVQRGQPIATVGKSGNATGYHLHFELIRDGKQVDPGRFVG